MRRAYSADTEILSRRGWLTIDKLRRDDHVATRTNDGRFQWQQPLSVSWSPYNGEMVWFHSNTADMLITPVHLVLHRARQRKRINGKLTELPGHERVTAALDLIGDDHISLIATSMWSPPDAPRQLTFMPRPGRADRWRNPARAPLIFSVGAADFAAFMGMYLAEGYLGLPQSGEYPIYISQSRKGNGFTQYQDLLDRIVGRSLPWRPSSGGSWCFRNKALYEYLETCGRYAWGKIIPREVLDLASQHLQTFWHYYWLGDGSTMRSAGRRDIEVINTTSRAVADAFQELLQKTGRWSIIHHVAPSDNRHGKRRQYRVLQRAGDVAFATAERVTWKGMTGSISIANGAVYTRRNDHPVWAGSA